YDRFGVVLFAPPDVVAAVDALKEHLPRSGQPDLPAHVTVKNTFVAPTDLDAIAARVAACCASARPFRLTTGPLYDYEVGDRLGTIGFTMAVEPAEAIVDLHRSLALAGRLERRPPDRDGRPLVGHDRAEDADHRRDRRCADPA